MENLFGQEDSSESSYSNLLTSKGIFAFSASWFKSFDWINWSQLLMPIASSFSRKRLLLSSTFVCFSDRMGIMMTSGRRQEGEMWMKNKPTLAAVLIPALKTTLGVCFFRDKCFASSLETVSNTFPFLLFFASTSENQNKFRFHCEVFIDLVYKRHVKSMRIVITYIEKKKMSIKKRRA